MKVEDFLVAEKYIEVEGNSFPTLMRIEWINHNKEEEFLLKVPRYLPLTGWIEIFFLQPQEEWVHLTDITNFRHSLTGIINNENFSESICIVNDLDRKNLIISIMRSFQTDFESGVYFENYTDKKIIGRYICNHSLGYLQTEIIKENISVENLDKNFREILKLLKERVESKRGDIKEICIWKKEWKVEGTLPEWKKEITPILIEKDGKCLEIGFIVEEGHGDWYKIFEYENVRDKFFIIEEGIRMDNFYFRGEKVVGKRSSSMYLFCVPALNLIESIIKEF